MPGVVRETALISKNPIANSAQRTETVAEVRELRQQVKTLSNELRQLRTEFSGSMQHLHSIDEDPAPQFKNRFSARLENYNRNSFDANDFVKPPLPPKLCKLVNYNQA